jgi:hypothetical protein
MFYSTNQSYHWKLNQSEVAISGRLANQIVRIERIRRGVTSFTSPSEQYIPRYGERIIIGILSFLTDHDHVHLREMRQRIYREDQPDQAYEDPPEGSNGVWADLFLWGM